MSDYSDAPAGTEPATKFDVGGVWDDPDWDIRYNVQCTHGPDGRSKPCPHTQETAAHDLVWPRVVVGFNESGYLSTGICLDCILDAAASLDDAIRVIPSTGSANLPPGARLSITNVTWGPSQLDSWVRAAEAPGI